jgi:hypothetical protein
MRWGLVAGVGEGMTLVAAQLISVLTAPAFFYAGVKWGQHEARKTCGGMVTSKRTRRHRAE